MNYILCLKIHLRNLFYRDFSFIKSLNWFYLKNVHSLLKCILQNITRFFLVLAPLGVASLLMSIPPIFLKISFPLEVKLTSSDFLMLWLLLRKQRFNTISCGYKNVHVLKSIEMATVRDSISYAVAWFKGI